MDRLRPATTADTTAIRELVRLAFSRYTPRIGEEPAPIGADYASLTARGLCWVAELDGRIGGLVVLVPAGDHLEVETLAVAPDLQGRGVGTRLLALADEQATAAGFTEIRLCTNEKMTENLAFYPRHGFRETHRAEQDGFCRVFFVREIVAPAG
ncbi:GNAT family N-acetyltransferase [Actinoplanes friuliensis]|uniref:N-acetyltransferase GCN5 n=1 Tax=Actinoplanes friuliensis DSM 7358 TaxID=1246995 RepID=U5VY01_9ACTN|nr:GNAT family N-acetyltransferase [Actinoplanes friuliensis]AGZ41764.1 N-acetyltransferase GCN5 [Actinoplanes friuliensis DSM 7358]